MLSGRADLSSMKENSSLTVQSQKPMAEKGTTREGAVTAVVSLDGHAMCSRESRSPCIQGKH